MTDQPDVRPAAAALALSDTAGLARALGITVEQAEQLQRELDAFRASRARDAITAAHAKREASSAPADDREVFALAGATVLALLGIALAAAAAVTGSTPLADLALLAGFATLGCSTYSAIRRRAARVARR